MEELKINFANSSLRTISVIKAANKPTHKVAWTLIICACFGVLIALMVQSMIFFLKYPIGTTTQVCVDS